jgi:RNA polymerase sigma-70 factor, ECF subfamily
MISGRARNVWAVQGRVTYTPAPGREAVGDVKPMDGGKTKASLEERPDGELLELVSAGVTAAFTEVVRRYENRVRRYCAKWCGDVALGDELAQDVFLDVWRGRQSYRPDAPFASYLFTLARNRCRSEGRRRRITDRFRSAAAQNPDTPSPDQLAALLVQERQRRVDAQIAALPRKPREALLLRYGAELDYRQIAEVLGISEVAARSRVFEATARLRKALGERT